MGKTIGKPNDKPMAVSAGATAADDSSRPIIVHGNPNLSPEQRQKYAELIEWLDRRRAAAERMAPEERAQAEADWKRFKQSMNDARAAAGARLIFGEND
jgi:alkanesulfonate monooxygenase SsuD/methylene tetrahydromethanopterin reductase-like flavin-dependent oxidoreductase (luciferase family)